MRCVASSKDTDNPYYPLKPLTEEARPQLVRPQTNNRLVLCGTPSICCSSVLGETVKQSRTGWLGKHGQLIVTCTDVVMIDIQYKCGEAIWLVKKPKQCTLRLIGYVKRTL